MTPRRSALDAEELRWRFYVGVAALACLAETTVAGWDLLHPASSHALGWESAFGAVFCAVLLAALLSRRIPLRLLDLLTTGAVTLALGAELWHAFGRPAAPPARLYFIGLFVMVSALTALPMRLALSLVGAVLAGYAALVLTRPGGHDVTLLVELTLATLLVLHLAVFGRQMSSERQEGRAYRTLALTDPLTGLANRRAMYQQLDAAFERYRAGQPFAVVLLDLDHFKSVNDQRGHEVGDLALRLVAETLHRHARTGDCVARWGGEEFLVLVHGADVGTAQTIAERFCAAVRQARAPQVPRVTASVGVAVIRPNDTVQTLLQRADRHLYRAKEEGRDRWVADSLAEADIETFSALN